VEATADRDVSAGPIEHWGVFFERGFVTEYYTRQPDPGRWVAVGVVTPPDDVSDPHRLMLVGAGRSEDAALSDLQTRITGVVSPVAPVASER
jgi:hypothetical protein